MFTFFLVGLRQNQTNEPPIWQPVWYFCATGMGFSPTTSVIPCCPHSISAPGAVLSSPSVVFLTCVTINCSRSFVYWVIILECIFVASCVLFYYVCTAVLHTLVAGLLARSQYLEGPATGHLGTGFSWFRCV